METKPPTSEKCGERMTKPFACRKPSWNPLHRPVLKPLSLGNLPVRHLILKLQTFLEPSDQHDQGKIELLGVTTTPYDVLLDEYEVGMKVEDYDPLFAGLRERLVPLLHAITSAQSAAEVPSLPAELSFPVEAQKAFCEAVSKNMGFDFDAGRMDASTHPFSAGLWPETPGLPPGLMRKILFRVCMP